jgi:hypothetical protein
LHFVVRVTNSIFCISIVEPRTQRLRRLSSKEEEKEKRPEAVMHSRQLLCVGIAAAIWSQGAALDYTIDLDRVNKGLCSKCEMHGAFHMSKLDWPNLAIFLNVYVRIFFRHVAHSRHDKLSTAQKTQKTCLASCSLSI